MSQNASKCELIKRIARYLRINPLASDTREGIARWWVAADGVDLAILDEALAWLVADGVVESVNAADGRVRYRRVTPSALNDARLDELAGAP